MELLRDWTESEYSHPMIEAVYKYLGRRTLIQDLIMSKPLEPNDNGIITDQVKI